MPRDTTDRAAQIDEAVTRDCSNACGAGVETCTAGGFDHCTAPADCPDNPDQPGDPTGYRAGCACETGGRLDASALAPCVLRVLLLRRRRR